MADLHGAWDEESPLYELNLLKYDWPEADVAVCAGDFTYLGDLTEVVRFNTFFRSLPYKHKILIAGNHCRSFYNNNAFTRQFVQDITYLQDSGVEIDGVKFWGTPWSPTFMDWFFMDSEEGLTERYKKIPDDTDIIISHSPPYDILDETKDHKKIGSKALLSRIKEIKPKFVIFGHNHEGYGKITKTIDGKLVTFLNCSSMDEEYNIVNQPVLIEI